VWFNQLCQLCYSGYQCGCQSGEHLQPKLPKHKACIGRILAGQQTTSSLAHLSAMRDLYQDADEYTYRAVKYLMMRSVVVVIQMRAITTPPSLFPHPL